MTSTDISDTTVIDKEELTEFITRLHQKRKNLLSQIRSAREMLNDRLTELPHFDAVQSAIGQLRIAKATLNDQKDGDSKYNTMSEKMRETSRELSEIEDPLSNALRMYMVEHKALTVHADPGDPDGIDREIKVEAKIGRKVSVQTSLFDQEDTEAIA